MSGYKVVPVEPTAEMRSQIMSGISHEHMVRNYKAMLAAAPAVQGERTGQDIQKAINSAPEELRELGEYLGRLLDEDQWPEAERKLEAAVLAVQPAMNWRNCYHRASMDLCAIGELLGVPEEDQCTPEIIEAIKALQQSNPPEQVEPVAWMHDSPERVDVIHAAVKKLLVDSHDAAGHLHRTLDKSEHYTIPLYAAPKPEDQQPKCCTCRDSGFVGDSDVCPECVGSWLLPAEQKPTKDVAALVEALEAIARNELDAQRAQHIAATALSSYCKGGEA